MKKNWNKDRLERRYNSILEDAKRRGFTDEDLESHYLNKICKKTKSLRILRFIELAYYLGQLRAISDIDEGYTVISLRDFHNTLED